MALLPKVFTASSVDMTEDELLPEAWYTAQIVKSEVKSASTGGNYMSLHCKIVEGDFKGRMVFDNLNIVNKNPTTVKIAEKALRKICDALGIEDLEDSVELHNQDIMIRVVSQAASSNYPAKSIIKDYKAVE